MRFRHLAAVTLLIAETAHGEGYEIDGRSGGGLVGSPVDPPRNTVQIETGTANSRATLQLRFSESTATPGPQPERTGRMNAWTLVLGAPVDKSDDDTELASFDGLANAFTIEGGYTRYNDAIRLDSARTDQLLARIRADSGNAEIALTEDTIRQVYAGRGQDEEMLRQLRSAFSLTSSSFWAFQAKVGREEFKYTDFSQFQPGSSNEIGWSLSFRFGRTYAKWLLAGEVRAEQSYKKADDVTKCQPIAGTTDLSCLSGPDGQPKSTDAQIIGVEARRQIGRFGLSPTLRFDDQGDVLSVDVPVFLWQDSSRNLSGGVRAGWRDDTKDFNVGLFVTTPFEF